MALTENRADVSGPHGHFWPEASLRADLAVQSKWGKRPRAIRRGAAGLRVCREPAATNPAPLLWPQPHAPLAHDLPSLSASRQALLARSRDRPLHATLTYP